MPADSYQFTTYNTTLKIYLNDYLHFILSYDTTN